MPQNSRPISNDEDTIDSRDVIARIEAIENLDSFSDEEKEELVALRKLAEEAEQYADDWTYGETLIRDSYFKDYAQELAEETGDVDFKKLKWPFTCIDWEQAARELKMDYTAVEFDGVTYWIR